MSSVNNNIPFVPENTIDPAAGLNESINHIDATLQLAVVSVGANSPPGSPADGARYVVGTAPTGAWAGQANNVARWLDGMWSFFPARIAVNLTDSKIWLRTASGWVQSTGGGGGGQVDSVTAGEGITVDNTDPGNPEVSVDFSVAEYKLTAGTGIAIDRTNPDAPVISATGGGGGMTNPMTSAGDIIVGGTSGAPLRLAIGTEGQIPVVRSGGLVYEDQAGGTVVYAPVVADTATSRTLSLTDAGDYLRFTNVAAVVCTIPPQSSVSWAAYTEIHIRRVGAGNLTLTPGAGVTLNAPSGGSLVLTAGMSVTLKRVTENEWDVIGQTVAA